MSNLLLLLQVLGATAAVDTLTLNTLVSSESNPSLAGVRAMRDGHIMEVTNSSWTNQNAGVEWIDNNAADIGDTYEARMTGTGDNPNGGGLSLNVWYTINVTRAWVLEAESEILSFSGTLTIREIANTGNSVSAFVTIDSDDEI